jgi:hypothetical protein
MLDGVFTIVLIGMGGHEINPIMRYFLRFGNDVFLIFKGCITVIGLTILSIFEQHRFSVIAVRITVFLYFLLVFYQTLCIYANS